MLGKYLKMINDFNQLFIQIFINRKIVALFLKCVSKKKSFRSTQSHIVNLNISNIG